MKEKFDKIKKAVSKTKKSKYGFLMSFVALVEVLMIVAVSTFAWVETISSIEISNATGIIDTFTYTNAEVGTGVGYTGTPIDLSNYYRASGNVHLSSASSADGKDFYFPQVANTGMSANSYRKGTINDKNTNYISFSLRVNAVGTAANFFFDRVPTFKIGDNVVTDNSVRVALTVADDVNVEGETKVYSYNAVDSENVVGNVDGTSVATTKINAFSDYDNSGDVSDNVLFTVPKDQSKIVTITLWLQDPDKTAFYAGQTVTANDFKIVTSVKNTKINFVDRTSAFNDPTNAVNTWQWVGNEDAKMWVYTPAGVSIEMTKDATDPTLWSVTAVSEDIGDINQELIFYRTASTVTIPTQSNCWNFWSAKLSDAGSATVPTYTAYGDKKAGSDKEGLGTWGSVAEIKLLGDNVASVLPKPGTVGAPLNVTLTTSDSTSVPMNWNNNFWRVFIPNDSNSKDLTLSFKNGAKSYSISAVNRDITESASTYRVTSATTGYWEAPAIVTAVIPTDYTGMGTVSVSGGPVGATTVKVTKGTTVRVKAVPTSQLYAFEGWYSDAECTKKVSADSEFQYVAAEKDVTYTFYAKFQYNVILTAKTDGVAENSDGGQVQINDNGTPGAKVTAKVQKGGSVKLIALPNTEDYNFMGWYDSNSNLVYDSTQTEVTITDLQETINLFAVYNVKTFVLEAYAATNGTPGASGDDTGGTVTFVPEGTSSGAYATITVKNTETVKYKAVVKDSDGYEFVGWFKDSACTDLYTTDLEFTADKTTTPRTFYAKFVLKKYDATAIAVTNGVSNSQTGGTVKVTANGVTTAAGATATTKVTHGTSVTFTAASKTGYNFVGWYDKATGGTKLASTLTYTLSGVAGDKTVYAIFKQRFTISLTARTDGTVGGAGGTVKAGTYVNGATSTAFVNYGDSITITALPTTAYNFVNWTYADGTSYGSVAQTTLTNVKSNYTLYGDFVKKTFTIEAYAVSEGSLGSTGGTVSFDTQAASDAYVKVTVDYDGNATFKAFVKASDGYEFKGWHTKSDCSDTAVSTLTEYTVSNITANKTLYAEFALKRYSVTANAVTVTGSDAGTVAEVKDGSEAQTGTAITINNVVHNSQVTLRAKPIEGATFKGWYDAETGGNQLADDTVLDYTFTVTDNTSVYARFTAPENETTTIYFAERSSFTSYYAYVYNSGTSGKEYLGSWPGTAAVKDATTGYYKVTFTTPVTEANGFRVIVSNKGSNQYPAKDGLLGDFGKTYLFRDSELKEYKPVSVTLNAVSVNASGVTQSNGFTGGTITVGSKTYSASTVLSYQSGDSFSATAIPTGDYEFKGWFTDAECTVLAGRSEALTATLSSDVTYYAKFVESSSTTRTIYFTNSNNHKWTEDKIYCYVWSDSDGDNGAWPGTKMTKVKTNVLGESVYSITFDKKFTKVIFHNNSGEQTVDITLGTANAYYLSGTQTSGKYNVSTYTES